MSKDKDIIEIRLVIIGDNATGRRQISNRFRNDKFDPISTCTIGQDFNLKKIQFKGKTVELQIFLTYGLQGDRYQNCVTCYDQADGFIVVYDVEIKSTFEGLDYWLQQIDKKAKVNTEKVIVGNKCDEVDRRQVSTEEGKKFAEDRGIQLYETSAMDGTNINEAFYYLIGKILEKKEFEKQNGDGSDNMATINLAEESCPNNPAGGRCW